MTTESVDTTDLPSETRYLFTMNVALARNPVPVWKPPGASCILAACGGGDGPVGIVWQMSDEGMLYQPAEVRLIDPLRLVNVFRVEAERLHYPETTGPFRFRPFVVWAIDRLGAREAHDLLENAFLEGVWNYARRLEIRDILRIVG